MDANQTEPKPCAGSPAVTGSGVGGFLRVYEAPTLLVTFEAKLDGLVLRLGRCTHVSVKGEDYKLVEPQTVEMRQSED